MPIRKMLPLLLSTIAVAAPACDPDEGSDACQEPHAALEMVGPPDFGDDDLRFREQGPPQGLYITALNGKPIGRAGAKAIIDACAKQVDPPQTCSLSWYQPDTSQPTRVLGVGCSMMASYPLWKCYVDFMVSQKAVAY